MSTNGNEQSSVLRNVLPGVRASAVVLALMLGLGLKATAEEGGKVVPGTWPPHPEVSFTRVFPLPDQEPQEVPTGDWIQHAFGWLPHPIQDNSKEQVEEFIRKHKLKVWIGGEQVEKPKQYYLPLQRPDDGLWIAVWAYSVPPKPPGIYTFKFRITEAAGAPSESEADYSVEEGEKEKKE